MNNDNPTPNTAVQLTPPNLKQRLARWIFPPRSCDYPEIEGGHKDTFRTQVTVKLAWADRLRIFFSGWLCVETRSVTEGKIGRNNTNGSFYVPAPNWLDPII